MFTVQEADECNNWGGKRENPGLWSLNPESRMLTCRYFNSLWSNALYVGFAGQISWTPVECASVLVSTVLFYQRPSIWQWLQPRSPCYLINLANRILQPHHLVILYNNLLAALRLLRVHPNDVNWWRTVCIDLSVPQLQLLNLEISVQMQANQEHSQFVVNVDGVMPQKLLTRGSECLASLTVRPQHYLVSTIELRLNMIETNCLE